MRATAGAFSNAVDLYNSATGAWSTARLSVARQMRNAAASVGNLAIFAGGWTGNMLLIEGALGVMDACVCKCFMCVCVCV